MHMFSSTLFFHSVWTVYLFSQATTCNSLETLLWERNRFINWWKNSLLVGAVIPVSDTSDDTCKNGALVPEQAVPGAYSQVCMTLPERIVPLSSGENIIIQQEAGGSGKTGMAVWNSGLLMTRVVQALATSTSSSSWFSQQESVLELGCGTGLVSIACHRLGIPMVLATDGNPDVLRLAGENIRSNKESSSTTEKKYIETKVLQWGLLNAMDFSEAADLVLGADLTYNSGTWRVLAESMESVLKPNGTVLYLSLGHEGFNVNAEVDGFLSVAQQVGLVSISELGGVDISKLVSSILSTSERNQLRLSGGVRLVALQRKELRKNL